MTLRARRWYYSFAILVFLLTAPLVVLTAAGWRWNGWRHGFVQTGTLLITSTQRAEIFVNGKSLGVTPKRLSGLTPGAYQLDLRRAGLAPWSHLVRLDAQTTTTIGPVRLFPPRLVPQLVQPSTFTDFITNNADIVAGLTTQAAGIDLQLLWPKKYPQVFTLPTTPTWIRLSPQQHRLAIGLATETRIYELHDSVHYRALPAGNPVTWLRSSESIAYRLESGNLIADDSLQQTRTVIGPATSMLVVDETLWFTSATSGQTGIYQRSDATAASARLVATLDGDWKLLAHSDRGLVIQETASGSGSLLVVNRLTGRTSNFPLNQISTYPDPRLGETPLWLNGADIMTLNADQEPVVLLRTSTIPQLLAWIDAPDFLVTVTPERILIRSVSRRQGRAIVIKEQLQSTDRPLLIDTRTAGVLLNRAGQLVRLSWE